MTCEDGDDLEMNTAELDYDNLIYPLPYIITYLLCMYICRIKIFIHQNMLEDNTLYENN